jgi:uncharacterized delta-60 repeat protein
MSRRKVMTKLLVILFLFVFAINDVNAGAGDFDLTFGTGGKLVTSMTAGGPAQINKVVVQPDGKIIAAGWSQNTDTSLKRFALVRYLADGSLDTSFGIGGKVFATFTDGNAEANDVVIQPNGRILVVGALFGSARYSSVVIRYNSNGSLDSSFSGDGILVYNYDSVASDIATSVALQPDGRILLAGPALTSVLGPAVCFYISRLSPSGTFDSTFNNTGKRLSEFGSFTSGHVKIGLQPDGKIIAAGPGGDGGSNYDFAVQRFNSNGSFDGLFGTAGRVYTNFNGNDIPKTLTMLPDGRFIVGGSSEESDFDAVMLVRYMPNGTKDSTFGFGGFVVQDVTQGADVVESIAVQPNGKTVVVGRGSGTNFTNRDFLVVRYLENGLSDPTFGISGVKRFSYGAGDDHGYSVAIQSNGRIVAGGAAETQTTNTSFVLARFLGRGTVGDYDSDGVSDVGVFRPSDGTWYLNRSDSGYTEYPFGTSTDRPVVGDFDGDGESDIAVFRPSNGRWYVLRSTAGYMTAQFGLSGDIPFPADFDGDDKSDIAVFRPSTGVWYYLKSSANNASSVSQQFGLNGDRPVPGDYDRDGRADLAVFRPSNGSWYILGSSRGFYSVQFGLSTDVPIPADLDGDMANDIAVYRPPDGTWHVLRSSDGSYQAIRFGTAGDLPQPGDFDLDGRSDIAVFRPADGVWHILRSSDGGYRAIGWGMNGDQPLAAAYIAMQ